MPASGTKLADANVWLALAFSDHQHHVKAREWFEKQEDDAVAFCRITQLALLRHLTNSKIMGEFVQTQQLAWATFDKFSADPRVLFLPEPPMLDKTFRLFSDSASPSHERWTDAYLATFALLTQSQIITFDSGFQRFRGLKLTVLHS